ncbi:MAG TPA: hypothetical protein VFV99_04640, partial [Kofleriaceae bacterium]|nr:hypothetical protein [Kofleriaceae bacterium]
ERLRSFLRDVFAVFESHRKFIKVAVETEHFKQTPSTTQNDLASAIGEIVKAGVKEKVLSPRLAEMLPFVISGTLKGYGLRRIGENGALEAADAEALVTIFLDGARK